MHADEQTNEILIFQGCKAPSRSGQVAHSRSHSLCWVGPAEEAAPTVGRGREEGSLSSPVLVGETMDMPLSALDMSIDMADAGELNPGFLSQVHAGGGHISYLTACTLPHFPWSTLACSCSALCKEHRGQWTPCRLRHIPQASAFISRSRASNERIRLHRCRILVG